MKVIFSSPRFRIGFHLLLLVLLALGCTSRVSSTSTPESRAVRYLSREVPAWRKDNGCYSCHNNGDGARALYLAHARGFNVKEALSETSAWLASPEKWKDNKGDPAFSDKKLAAIQFSAGLATAVETRALKNREASEAAAKELLDHQDTDGSWHVEDSLGSPVTYGNELATYMAMMALRGTPQGAKAAAKARAWIEKLKPRTTLSAAVILMTFPQSTEAAEFLRKKQTSSGGWGPYAGSPPETFDTALAVLALRSLAGKEWQDIRLRGRRFLIAEQLSDGSWLATTRPSGGESYAQKISTTAWATQALLSD